MAYNTRYRSLGLPGSLPDGVKWLLIANVAVFLVTFIFPSLSEHLLLLSLAPVMVLALRSIRSPSCAISFGTPPA
jgi:hypothetical protein